MAFALLSITFVARFFAVRRGLPNAAIAIAVLGFASCRDPDGNRIVIPPVTERWNGWENLGGTTSAPECVTAQPGRIDCFTRGAGQFVWRHQWDGQHWSGPSQLAGIQMDSFFDSRPECVSGEADVIDCFIRQESDKAMFQRTMYGTFMTGWEPRSGNLSTDPECVTAGARRLDCFARENSGNLIRNSFDGNLWSGWTSLGVQILDQTRPSCVRFRGEINCIVVTPASTLRQIRFTPQGVEGRDMQGGAVAAAAAGIGPSAKCYVTTGPDPNSTLDDKIHCFAPRIGQLARWNWDGQGNLNWSLSNLGSGITGDWDCVVRSEDRIDCMELFRQTAGLPPSTSLVLRHRVLETGQGVAMANVNLSPPGSLPLFIRCLALSADRIDCFAGGENSPLLHAWLTKVDSPSLPVGRRGGG